MRRAAAAAADSAPNGETEGTPRDGVTAGRAALAMFRATGEAAVAGAVAAGRRLAPPGAEPLWGALGDAGVAKGLPARPDIPPGAVGAEGADEGAVLVAVACAVEAPCADAACADPPYEDAACDAAGCADAPLPPSIAMRITPPQTEQRARTPPAGTRAGSTRKTDRHSPQAMFTGPPRFPLHRHA